MSLEVDSLSPQSRLERRAARLALEVLALRGALREAHEERDYAVRSLLVVSGVAIALAGAVVILVSLLVL